MTLPFDPMAPTVAPEQQPPAGQQATTLGNQAPTTAMVDANPLAPPPPPMDKVRGKDYPATDAPAGEKLEFLRRLLQQTDAEHLARAKQLAHHTLIANGKQHISWSNRSRRWEETPLMENDPLCDVNLLKPKSDIFSDVAPLSFGREMSTLAGFRSR